mmetsp:Transcript_34053/g.85788  ORF Transcript_34053/g.85788 Transcript_34053/m.85788 type:complete len:362 (+) Transcript_34053:659-1744(+)
MEPCCCCCCCCPWKPPTCACACFPCIIAIICCCCGFTCCCGCGCGCGAPSMAAGYGMPRCASPPSDGGRSACGRSPSQASSLSRMAWLRSTSIKPEALVSPSLAVRFFKSTACTIARCHVLVWGSLTRMVFPLRLLLISRMRSVCTPSAPGPPSSRPGPAGGVPRAWDAGCGIPCCGGCPAMLGAGAVRSARYSSSDRPSSCRSSASDSSPRLARSTTAPAAILRRMARSLGGCSRLMSTSSSGGASNVCPAAIASSAAPLTSAFASASAFDSLATAWFLLIISPPALTGRSLFASMDLGFRYNRGIRSSVDPALMPGEGWLRMAPYCACRCGMRSRHAAYSCLALAPCCCPVARLLPCGQ